MYNNHTLSLYIVCLLIGVKPSFRHVSGCTAQRLLLTSYLWHSTTLLPRVTTRGLGIKDDATLTRPSPLFTNTLLSRTRVRTHQCTEVLLGEVRLPHHRLVSTTTRGHFTSTF